MNITDIEMAVLKDATAEQSDAALRELNQLQLAMLGTGIGETILV